MESLEAIKIKISKLLALATSDNEAEAALAMSMAQTLIERHKLDIAELKGSEAEGIEEEAIIRDEEPIFSGGRITTWKTQLAMTLAKLNGCSLVKYMGQGKALGGERGSKLMIFGRPSDISNTRYLLAYAIIQLTRIAPRGMGKEYANSWYLGAVNGISQKMQEAKKQVQATASSYALVKLNDQDRKVENYILGYCGKLRKGTGSQGNINGDAFNRGNAAGRNIDMGGSQRLGGNATLSMN